ncbi:MAG: aminotransferase class I/II-fold pyridoxal phosphate-dependent enzyme [Verrucomicrobia bacterium]|nr:aminotransferase class I/II-fold pyridoxal phosphate-dependent enzyme [Verrucomicrobiota bacterium]
MTDMGTLRPLRKESTGISTGELASYASTSRPPASRRFTSKPITLRLAMPQDHEEIFRLRHEVYARELGQHTPRPEGRLRDALDDLNVYLVASLNGVIAGFISITPPEGGRFSVDKYLRREDYPQLAGKGVYEVRLLTVTSDHRGREIACALMYAALRWVETRGGERIVAIGRREILDLYLHVGLERLGRQFQSGAVTYELLAATVAHLRARLPDFAPLLNRLERSLDWRLDYPFRKPAKCFHGGAFFDAIGPEFDHLERRHTIINADVLDAWFPPSPRVMAALQKDLPWLLRTSPPTGCEGMVQVIARTRGVAPENILPAAGSSDGIFLAFRHWLKPSSRVLILDPTYGEYAHVLEQVVRCRVDRLALSRENNYRVDVGELERLAQRGYDLIALVNPNSPTGQHVSRREMEQLLSHIPVTTRVWIDETYVEYAGPDESLERFAAASRNVVVCKSMSKVYALSGVRAAYLCGPAPVVDELRSITPPWAVSLPAQVAAVVALQDSGYYAARYVETHQLHERLARQLAEFAGWEIIPGIANFLLCHLPKTGPTASELVNRCRAHGLFLRDVGAMGRNLGQHTLRIAVKDAATNERMIEILTCARNGNRC